MLLLFSYHLSELQQCHGALAIYHSRESAPEFFGGMGFAARPLTHWETQPEKTHSEQGSKLTSSVFLSSSALGRAAAPRSQIQSWNNQMITRI